MARKKKSTLRMNFPINVRLDSNSPYRGGVIVNGVSISETNTLITCAEIMNKLKPIEQYLLFEPITE